MYWKQTLNVPPGIRYISEWTEFNLQKFQGHNIIHKQLPGCGFTEFALTCPEPVVLGSPRKMLMQNKKDQHGDNVFLVESKFDRELEIDEDISKDKDISKKDISLLDNSHTPTKEEVNTFYIDLFNDIDQYLHRMYQENKPPKIIVTYDSTYIVKEILESMGILDRFWFIVDEFQSLLEDARFKADTELSFLTTTLPSVKNVTYVSATPMLDKYISQISELNVPYYQLDWGALDPTRIKRPDLKIRTMGSIVTKMTEVIQSYLEKKFEKVVVENGGYFQEIESRECVIYVNSVNHIINIIKKMRLSPDQVNILCSDTPENKKKIEKKLGKRLGYEIGKVPLRGEPHKMFTFCTRTVYLGADFYSTNARSFIFSDSNADCLSVDISMDLAQILGRQRLEENPWHNSAEFYYRVTADYKKMSWEDLKKIIEQKTNKTNNLLSAYTTALSSAKNDLASNYLTVIKVRKYKDDYVSVNKLQDGTLVPAMNILVRINDERTFDIQQIDYRDRFSVFCTIKNQFQSLGTNNETLFRFFSEYDQLTTYVEKIHLICDFILLNPEFSEMVINNLSDSDKIKQQLIVVGPERIASLGYNLTRINKEMGITIFDKSSFDSEIFKYFKLGERYTKKYIKEILGSIYKAADFNGTAKANDLENWFEIKEVRISDKSNRVPGFEILSIKQITDDLRN